MLRLCKSLWETFLTRIAFTVFNEHGKGSVIQLWTVFQPVYHVTCRRVLWNETFYTFLYQLHLDSVSAKIRQPWGLSFFLKMFKIEYKFRKWKKKLENVFGFWDHCIWKCCYKLSLFRREYLLSAVNWLTNSSKIFFITLRHFFNLNCVRRDQ